MSEKTKKCPKCGEEIMLSAKKCKHCNSDLRSWFARHPLITIFVILPILISMISAAINDSQTTSPNGANSQDQAAVMKNQEEIKNKIKQIEIASSKIEEDSIGTPNLIATFKNNSDRAVDAVTLEAYFLNNYNEPVSEWNSKSDKPFYGTIQEKINPGGSHSSQWNLAVYDHATKIKSIRIIRVHFVGGEELSIE
ncbi:MAG: hypothetical protein V1867_08535 [Candidatus Falkowbacteria bacterium]